MPPTRVSGRHTVAGSAPVSGGDVGLAQGAVDRGDDRLERGGDDRGVDPDAPQHALADGAFDVCRRLGVAARAHRVLGIVQDPHVDAELGEHRAEGRDRSVALTVEPSDLRVGGRAVPQPDVQAGVAVLDRLDLGGGQTEPAPRVVGRGEVLVLELVPQVCGRDLAAVLVDVALDDPGELDLQPTRQLHAALCLHDVGDAALAGLAVDPHDGLIAAAEVVRVHRQVGHRPRDSVDVGASRRSVLLQPLEALLDGVLVRTGEGGEDQVAAVGVALVDRDLVAVLDGPADLVDVGEVDLGVDALGEQVHAHRHQVDVAGALTVAEQASFDPVGAGEQPELGGRNRGPPVVVRVQADDERVAPVELADHPLDRVGIDVGRDHLDRCRQVDDHLVVGRRVDDVNDGVADPHGEVQLGASEGLRRVFVEDLCVGDRLLELLDQAGALDGDVDDPVLVQPEDDPPLQGRGRVVEVDDRLLGPADRVKGPLNEVVAALGEHLDRHVVGDVAALDELAAEVEVGLACAGEADLDVLVAHPHEQVEHPLLAFGVHRVDECLVAVTQVHRRPPGGLGQPVGRPGPVREVDRDLLVERHVLAERHTGRGLWVAHRESSSGLRGARPRCPVSATVSATRGAVRSGLVAAGKEEPTCHAHRVCRPLPFRPTLGLRRPDGEMVGDSAACRWGTAGCPVCRPLTAPPPRPIRRSALPR
jgi:hypothetical protein